MANACLRQWYTPGQGVREIPFWGGSDLVEMLVDCYEVDHNTKWLAAARNIVDYLIDYGRDQLGYYPGSYSDSDGTWNLDRRYLFPGSVQLMGQACAAAAILRVAQVTATPLAATSATAAKATDLFPNPATNRLTLQANRQPIAGTVTVADALGRSVLIVSALGATLDVSSLAPGVYTVSWLSGGQHLARRFVKQAE